MFLLDRAFFVPYTLSIKRKVLSNCGVVCSNGEDIKSVFCEIDWYMLYHVMIDRHALYVVHHPVSDFALRLSEINLV